VVKGSLLDGQCHVTSGGVGCWDGSSAIPGAAVTSELACFNASAATAGDGSYELVLPYRSSEHGTTVRPCALASARRER